MFESLGFENISPLAASLVFGAVVGALFGIFAQLSRFCLRRALVGPESERRSALAVWLTALATALIGTQFALHVGVIDFSTHRFHNSDLPIMAILVGGLLFGTGMVLTRGCISRMTVLTGSGNLRAITVLIIFAVVSHAMLKGILAPVRVWLAQFTVNVGEYSSLAFAPGGRWAVVAFLVVAVVLVFGEVGQALVQLFWVHL